MADQRRVGIVMPGLVPGIHVFSPYWHSKTWMTGTSPAMTVFGGVLKSLNQILPGDDLTEPRVIRNEFLNELMDAVLEDIVHMAVFKPVADAAGVALRGALAAVGDTDLVEVAHQIAVAARQRARQRVVEDQQVGDQP